MVKRANQEAARRPPSTPGLIRRSGRIPALPYPPIKPLYCTEVADSGESKTIHSEISAKPPSWRLAIRRWAGAGCHRLSRDGAERLRSQRGFRRVRVDWCQRGGVVDTRCRFILHPTGNDLVPIHSRRLATLVAQPVTITLPLGSKISRATVSVNASPSILTSMARVSLCVCIQTPAGLKTKASVTAL